MTSSQPDQSTERSPLAAKALRAQELLTELTYEVPTGTDGAIAADTVTLLNGALDAVIALRLHLEDR